MKKIFLILLLLACMPIVFAQISMKVNQTEYYFLVGQDAVIPIEVNNSYGKNIPGVFEYTVTQEVNQGGFHYSSSNSQSSSFNVEGGIKEVSLGFGSTDQPSDLKVAMSFNFNEGGTKKVTLQDLIIHFVQDESQKQDQQNQQTSQEQSQEQTSQQEQKSLSEQMQEQIDKMFNQEPTEPSAQEQAQQRLQNNQMNQDSSALKNQMQQQLAEKQQMEEKFKENVASNPDFQKKHQELLDQGYQMKDGKVDASTNNTGNFDINYEKEGEQAKLSGEMDNGSMSKIRSSEDDKKLMQQLANNTDFRKFDEMLRKEGFNASLPEIIQQENKTQIKMMYTNAKNETATITATALKEEIEEVNLERERDKGWIWLVVLGMMLILAYVFYKRKFRKKEVILEEKKQEKPVDYRKEAVKMLAMAVKLFEKEQFKDAYGKSAEAIRFYYSYKVGLKKEMTNSDLIKLLIKKGINHGDTQKALNLCSMVEFAKYTANKNDFDEIISLARKVIG